MIKDFDDNFRDGHEEFKNDFIVLKKSITINNVSYDIEFDSDLNNLGYLLSYIHTIKINIDKTQKNNELNCVCNDEKYKKICKTKCSFGSKYNVFSAQEPGENGKIVQCTFRLNKIKNINHIIDNYGKSNIFTKTSSHKTFSKKFNRRINVERHQILLMTIDNDGPLNYILILDKISEGNKQYFHFVTGYPITDQKYIDRWIK